MKKQKKIKTLVLATSRHTQGGISSVVATLEKSDLWRNYGCRWIPTHTDGSKAKKLSSMLKGLAQYIFQLPGTDIVHVHTSFPRSVMRKSLFIKLARLTGKKIIVHLHITPDTENALTVTHHNLYNRLFKHADQIIVLHHGAKNIIVDAFPEHEEKINVVYNPSPTTPEKSAPEVPVEKKTILYAGILAPPKGYEQLLRAFAKIAQRHPGWRLVMAGTGEVAKAREIAEELGIADRVDFPGWVAGENKHKLFMEAAIFCQPSFKEGFSMAIIEAWAYGLPVVATPVGGTMEAATEGETIITFKPGNIEELAVRLGELMADGDLQKKMGADSIKLINSTFNIKAIESRLKLIYDEALRPKGISAE